MTRRWRMISAAILIAIALLVAFYAIWAFVHVQAAVGQALDAGQLTADDNQFEIAGYFMANSGDYAIAAVTFAALGLLLFPARAVVRGASADAEVSIGGRSSPGGADDDLDDLLSGMPPETTTR